MKNKSEPIIWNAEPISRVLTRWTPEHTLLLDLFITRRPLHTEDLERIGRSPMLARLWEPILLSDRGLSVFPFARMGCRFGSMVGMGVRCRGVEVRFVVGSEGGLGESMLGETVGSETESWVGDGTESCGGRHGPMLLRLEERGRG